MALIGLGITALLTLTGCDLPDVTMSPSLSTGSSTEPADPSRGADPAPVTTTAAAAAPASPSRRSGDLDSGSITRVLKAGSRTVVVDYWTDENAKAWAAEGTKSIQIAAHVEPAGDDAPTGSGEERLMKVTRFAATLDDGASRSVVAEDRGEFAIMPPYSYTTALTLPPSPSQTTDVVLYVQFDLLVETQAGSQVFFRQTVLDTLRLPLSEEISQ